LEQGIINLYKGDSHTVCPELDHNVEGGQNLLAFAVAHDLRILIPYLIERGANPYLVGADGSASAMDAVMPSIHEEDGLDLYEMLQQTKHEMPRGSGVAPHIDEPEDHLFMMMALDIVGGLGGAKHRRSLASISPVPVYWGHELREHEPVYRNIIRAFSTLWGCCAGSKN